MLILLSDSYGVVVCVEARESVVVVVVVWGVENTSPDTDLHILKENTLIL